MTDRRTPALPVQPGPAARPPLERWRAMGDDVAVLNLQIPADAARGRLFEIAFSMQVRPLANAKAPWHAMRVEADGELQWERRIDTDHPADYDGLDYRFQRSVAVGRSLRLRLTVSGHQVRRLKAQIEADEV